MANAKPENGKQAANPRQLLILAALFAVLVTVGVVQFGGLLGGGAPPAPNPSGQPNTNAQTATPQTEQSDAGRLTLPPLAPRDPFRPVIAVPKPEQEPSRVAQSEPTNRPKREIAGTPPLAPMTLPPGQFGLQPAENAPAPEPPTYTITGRNGSRGGSGGSVARFSLACAVWDACDWAALDCPDGFGAGGAPPLSSPPNCTTPTVTITANSAARISSCFGFVACLPFSGFAFAIG